MIWPESFWLLESDTCRVVTLTEASKVIVQNKGGVGSSNHSTVNSSWLNTSLETGRETLETTEPGVTTQTLGSSVTLLLTFADTGPKGPLLCRVCERLKVSVSGSGSMGGKGPISTWTPATPGRSSWAESMAEISTSVLMVMVPSNSPLPESLAAVGSKMC